MADACITNSKAGSEYLIEILKAKKELVFVQPYEIPDEHTLPAIASDGVKLLAWGCPELSIPKTNTLIGSWNVIGKLEPPYSEED